jgi:beta-glucosidase/6-phospho-beta-glucosidase/beta-galactosidase
VSPTREPTESDAAPPAAGRGLFPEHFQFGVATAGFQVEGGFNGPGEPANNWLAWEQTGRVEPSGDAVGFWARPEEALDRAADLGCDSFRLGVEWARVVPDGRRVDRGALARYVSIVAACVERGLAPLVTLHHFTHPDWLGQDLWLRPDAPARFAAWARIVVPELAPFVRHWVTLNELNILAVQTYLTGDFPPGRTGAFDDAAVALDNLVAAHVLGYDVIHAERPDAVVTTNNYSLTVYEYDRMLVDLVLARSQGVVRRDLDGWLAERRRLHYSMLATPGPGESLLRRAGARLAPYGSTGRGSSAPRRALDALEASPHERTLDVLGVDHYDPHAARHFRLPWHRTAGGRSPSPVRQLWDDPPDPAGLTRWLGVQAALAPGLPLWVVENGMCNRVLKGRAFGRLDGWDRPRYLREHVAAVVAAVDAGVPVEGYWHWSLVDNYEWGSYEPRFGLFGVDRDRGASGGRWLGTDAMGRDAAGTYRSIIAGLRAGDRTVLDPR